MINDKIPLAGVIGKPVAHSRSPRLHGHWLKRYHLQGHYIPMEVGQGDLHMTLTTLRKIGFVGLNVTIPHKEKVLELADVVTDRAAIIGAANTLLFRQDGRIQADNTDGYGFLQNIRQHIPGWTPDEGPVVVLGAGGAARAVLVTLIETGAKRIYLANRTRTRADALRTEFGTRIEVVDWVKVSALIEEAKTIINTTSLGMTGQPEMRISLDGLRKGTLVTDLVYSPLDTPLLQTARAAGCITVDGLGMLLHQAVPGFERWFGHRPEVDDELRAAVLA